MDLGKTPKREKLKKMQLKGVYLKFRLVFFEPVYT